MKAKIRKIVTFVDETLSEQGRAVDPPIRRAAAVAVIENPFAGAYQEDLALLIGPDQPWLSTTAFLDKIDENLKKAMAA